MSNPAALSRSLFLLVPITCSFHCWQVKENYLCCILFSFALQSQTVSGTVQRLYTIQQSRSLFILRCRCIYHVGHILLQTLLKTTNKLLAGDLHSSLSNLKRQSVHSFIPKSFRCAICHRVFIEEFDSGQRDDLIVYR